MISGLEPLFYNISSGHRLWTYDMLTSGKLEPQAWKRVSSSRCSETVDNVFSRERFVLHQGSYMVGISHRAKPVLEPGTFQIGVSMLPKT